MVETLLLESKKMIQGRYINIKFKKNNKYFINYTCYKQIF